MNNGVEATATGLIRARTDRIQQLREIAITASDTSRLTYDRVVGNQDTPVVGSACGPDSDGTELGAMDLCLDELEHYLRQAHKNINLLSSL